jgi:hypothetical protein
LLYSVTVRQKILTSKFVKDKKVSDEVTYTETTTHDLPYAAAINAKKKFEALGQFVSMSATPVSYEGVRSRMQYGTKRDPEVKMRSAEPKKAAPKPVEPKRPEIITGYAEAITREVEKLK